MTLHQARTGSQEYIVHLADAAARADIAFNSGPPELWAEFDNAWQRLIEGHFDNGPSLSYFASIAMALQSAITGTPIPQLAAKAVEMHIAKNRGYATERDVWSNFRLATHFGTSAFRGVLIRLSDKYSRTQNLRRNPANDQVGESIADTLLDATAYALIARCLLEEGATA